MADISAFNNDVEEDIVKTILTSLFAFIIVLAGIDTPVRGQEYPNRPIKLVIPYPPGASTDALGRMVAQKMTDSMGQSVVVENRGGASGNIGSDMVAKAAADGYTFLLGTDATHGTNVFLFQKFPYDPAKDFTPLTLAVKNIIVLVVPPSLPVRSVGELIEYGKANPGKLSYGTSGAGSPHHLSGELLHQMTGVDLVHVPYKGGGPALTDLLGGQIPMLFASLVSVEQYIRSGKMRALAITDVARYKGLPDVPIVAETLPGFEMTSWLGFFGPAGLPQPVVTKLHEEIVKALNKPDVRPKLEATGLEVVGNTPDQFAGIVRRTLETRGALVRSAGIKAE